MADIGVATPLRPSHALSAVVHGRNMISLSLCAMASAGALPSWRPCQQETVRIVNGCSTFGPFYHTSPESGHVKRFFRSGSILGRPGAKRHRRTASPNLPPAPKVNRKKCFLKKCFLGAVRFVFTTLGQEKLVRSVVRVDTEEPAVSKSHYRSVVGCLSERPLARHPGAS